MFAPALLGDVLLSPALRADTHRFAPTQFHTTYSFAHPPVLPRCCRAVDQPRCRRAGAALR